MRKQRKIGFLNLATVAAILVVSSHMDFGVEGQSCTLTCTECPSCINATCSADAVYVPPKSDFWPPKEILQRPYGPSPEGGPFLEEELAWFKATVLESLPSSTKQSETEYALTEEEVKLVMMGLAEWQEKRASNEYTCVQMATALTKRAAYLQHVQKMNHFMYWDIDWITVVLDQAKAYDAVADSEGTDTLEPLYCYPIPLKGTMATKDFPASLGFAVLHEMYAVEDADLVKLVKEANGVLFGKTNVPELAHSWGTGNYVNGICFNPWDYDMMSGGSSGGSGAAVAAYTAALAITEDTEGSTNTPAVRNHLFGYDPPKFHYPNGGNPSLSVRNDQLGLNARSIDDIIAFDRAVLQMGEAHTNAEAYVTSLENSDITIGCSFVYYDSYKSMTEAIEKKYDEAEKVLKDAGFKFVDECQKTNPMEAVPDLGNSYSVWYAELATYISEMLGSDINPWDVLLNGFYDFGTTLSAGWMYANEGSGCGTINGDTAELRELYSGPIPANRSDAYNTYFDKYSVDLMMGPTQYCDKVLWTEDMGANGGCDGGKYPAACMYNCHSMGVIGSRDKTFTKAKFVVPIGLTDLGEPFSLHFMSRSGPYFNKTSASEWVYDEEGPTAWNLEELYMIKRIAGVLESAGLKRADATMNAISGLFDSSPPSVSPSAAPVSSASARLSSVGAAFLLCSLSFFII